MFMPFNILGMWVRALLSLVILAGGIVLLTLWYNHRETRVVERVDPSQDDRPINQERPVLEERVRIVPWQFGFNRETAFLLGGLALLAWSLGGGWVMHPRMLRKRGTDEPQVMTGVVQKLRLADGTSLHVEFHGPSDGDPVVLTHGWGLDNQEWYYCKKQLTNSHRLIVWDLPGLGKSASPVDRDWSLEKLASHLDAVIALAGNKPVVLLGHSIGAMITLTYCQLFPASLGSRVRGLVLAHGTYTNPVKTTKRPGLYSALQKPVLEPLCHLMIWLSPLLRLLNWLSYWNGSAHRGTERDSFSGYETRGQLDFITSYYCKASPAVVARGMLAMLRFDATAILPSIPIPTLVVAGDKDDTCRPEASQHMANTIPAAKLVTLAPAKHCGLFEHYHHFHLAVQNFLNVDAHLRGQSASGHKTITLGVENTVMKE